MESIALGQYGNQNGEGQPRPGGILRRAQTDASDRPNQRNVAWNSATLPSSSRNASQSEEANPSLGGRWLSDSSPAGAVGDWQHTLRLHRRRRRLQGDDDMVDGITDIAQAMEEDELFMADDVDGKVKRMNAFRELTEPLADRKEIRRRLTNSSRHGSGRISCWQRFKYSLSMRIFKSKESFKAATTDYSLWHNEIKVIEGIFGAGVGTYFRFLRYLFLLNLAVAVLLCGFVLTPQLLGQYSGHFSNGTNSINTGNRNDTVPFRAMDGLTGMGWLLTSELYYGGYSNLTMCAGGDTCTPTYDLKLAYFFTVTVCYLVYLIIIAHRVIQLYKEHTLSGAGGDVGGYIMTQVFTAWDFSITDKAAAKVKHTSIGNELKALSSELELSYSESSRCETAKLYSVRAVCWLGVLTVMALIAWFEYELLDKGLDQLDNGDTSYWLQAGTVILFPAVLTTLLLLLPLILEHFVVKLEGYANQRMEVAVTLARTTLLELLVLGILVAFWFSRSPGFTKPGQTPVQTIDTCWESALGAELYRLTVMDFLVQVVGSVCIMITKKCCPAFKLFEAFAEFSVARNTLHLVYNQTLLWAALFFAPLLSLVSVIKLVVLFYLQKLQVVSSQKPTPRPWRAAQTETVFFALILVSLVVAALALVFMLVRGCSSTMCGPLAGLCPYADVLSGVSGDSAFLLTILRILTMPGVVLALIVCLCIGVYWARSMATGRAELVAVLRHQLEMEAKDRAFLVKLADEINNGHRLFGMSSSNAALASPSHRSPSSPSAAASSSNGITKAQSFTFSHQQVSSTQGPSGGMALLSPSSPDSRDRSSSFSNSRPPVSFYTPDSGQRPKSEVPPRHR